MLSRDQTARCTTRLRSFQHMGGIIYAVPNQQRDILAGERMLPVMRFLISDVIAEMAVFE